VKSFKFKSIQTRLVFWFLIISLVPLLAAVSITYSQRVEVIESRTLDKLMAIRDLKVERLQDWLDERSSDLQVMSTDIELRSLKNIVNKGDMEIIRKFISRYLTNYKAYSEIFIVDPVTGKVIISTNAKMEGKDKSDDDYFNKPMQSKRLTIQDIYQSKTLSSHAMAFSIPILYTEHDEVHVSGVLVARIDLDHSLFSMLLDRVGLGETGETLIVNSDVMALNELRFYKDAPLKLQIKALPAVYASQGRTGITMTTDYRGEEVMAAYTYIPETGWGFVSKQDVSELNRPIREMIKNAIILFTLTAIFIFLVAVYISRTISKPVIGLNALANRITDGDLSNRIDIESHDELGSLSGSINLMADSIQGWNETLTEKVESRTEELEKKNAELERFTYTVSHDLKSPLVTIKGFVGLLEQDANKGDKKRMASDISHITEAALTMQTLLDELLEFSRVGRLDNPYEEFSMYETVEKTVSVLSTSIQWQEVWIEKWFGTTMGNKSK
jgi:signal transduction histidine kinase